MNSKSTSLSFFLAALLASGVAVGVETHLLSGAVIPSDSPLENRLVQTGRSHRGGQWGVVVGKHYAYLGVGSDLVVIDIRNPHKPKELARLTVPGRSKSLALKGDYVYIGSWCSGIHVLDVSDPKNPRIVSAIDLGWESIFSLGNLGDGLLAQHSDGLHFLDLADPEQPHVVCEYPIGLEWTSDGDYLCLMHYDNEAMILDVSDPTQPLELGIFEFWLPIKGMFLDFPYLYASTVYDAAFPSDFSVVDFSDLENPVRKVISGRTYEWLVPFRRMLIGSNNSGLDFLDISEPTSPSVIVAGQRVGMLGEIIVDRNFGFGLGRYNGLGIVDFGNIREMNYAEWYDFGWDSWADAAITSDTRMLTNSGEAFDIADPWNPRHLGVHPFSSTSLKRMVLFEHYAYSGGCAIDLYDPSEPQNLEFNRDWHLGSVNCIDEGYLYSSREYGAESSLRIYDLADPSSPILMGTQQLRDYFEHAFLAVDNGRALIVDRLTTGPETDLYLLNVEDPTNAAIIQSRGLDNSASILGVHINNGYIYIWGALERYQYGLHVFSVDGFNPNQPIATFSFPEFNGVQMVGREERLYFSHKSRGVFVVDISDPLMPFVSANGVVNSCSTGSVFVGGETVGIASLGSIYLFTEAISLDKPRKPMVESGLMIARDKSMLPSSAPVGFMVFPNPFNPQTTISFYTDQPEYVNVAVYDIRGRLISNLSDQHYQPGEHSVKWQGRDSAGRAAPSGQYFFRIESGGEVQIKKALLLK